MKKTLAMLLSLVLLAGALAGCGGSPSSGDGGLVSTDSGDSLGGSGSGGSSGDTLVVAVPDAPIHLDPQIQASIASYRVTTQMFDRLVHLDNDMNLVPGLAESWEVEDETTTVFHLRQDVKFHNGEPMTAEDVKYSLERCIASDGVNYNYLIISDIQIVDDYTIKIVTSEPFNALLYRLTLDAASIISKVADESGEDFNKNPVGAGPFRFVSWELGGDVVLEAFPDYYKGEAGVKTLIFRQIPEAISRTIGLETGEVDLAFDLAITDLDTIEANDALTAKEVVSTTVWYMGINTTKENLDNVKVRQALAYALNMQDIIDIVFNGVATPARNTMLTPSIFGHVADPVKYDTDIEKAKELLAEAGLPDGFDTTLWLADSQTQRDMSVVIQEQLRQIGVNVEIKSMEQGSFYSATGNGDHDLFILSKTSIDPDSMLRAMYHTEAFGLSGNRSFWATPEVDGMLDRACVTIDMDESADLYKQVQEIVAEELPLVPIAIEHLNAGMQNHVKGFDLYPGKSHYIYGTYLD